MTQSLVPEVTQQMIEGVPVVVLGDGTGQTRVAAAPRLGGLVMQLVLGNRQWLHRNIYVPLQPRYEGKVREPGLLRTYGERGDVGLGDQCLFTVAPDTLTLPDGTKVALNDHGEAWPLQPPNLEVSREGDVLRTEWNGPDGPLPFQLIRDLRIEDGAISCHFRLTNIGARPIPLFWSSHDMVQLDADTRFELPLGTEMLVHQSRRVEFQPGVHRWPRFTLRDGRPVDLSHPIEVRAAIGRDFAVKIFSREVAGALKLHQKDGVLVFDAPGTRAGLWINWGGDSPPGERYQLACPERCLGGTTDRVSDAVAANDTEWLEPKAHHEWTMCYSAG